VSSAAATTTAVVVDVVRSPIGKGKPGGALHDLHAVEMLAQVISALFARNAVDPGTVEDVIIGCVS
jgi:acetyl-CoA acyltransferase